MLQFKVRPLTKRDSSGTFLELTPLTASWVVGQFDCGGVPGWNIGGPRRILWMARDSWVENLRCPNCRKTGEARLSAADEDSWDVQVDSIPEGFKVLRLENGLPNFLCVLCDIAAEP